MLEIQGATKVLHLKNNPFVIISFDKKIFCACIIKHSLNPIWDEKFFHTHEYENIFKFKLKELMEGALRKDKTGLYEGRMSITGEGGREFKLLLAPAEGVPGEAKHNLLIFFTFLFEKQCSLSFTPHIQFTTAIIGHLLL
ncbi:hypothetical protein PILCRDRAFT_763603 [Piloderma croceum F 1598]|uniref:C2 domain-containing protein n=1 Tax=Piloderma croceum (strain F 1598) TaxID=765440 RepID=A0A0C3GJI8_PILCF|nr:hypothetical protein PILCRDRAFT_763603 [Piloderma croceum F 1598]